MDYNEILISIVGSMGLVSLATYLFKNLLIEKLKSKLAEDRSIKIEEVKSDLKKDTECMLGDHASEREYILEARKKIYASIGPLHFQLLIASRDAWGRIWRHPVYCDKTTGKPYSLSVNNYYGLSTLYRILRPLAIAEIIERRMGSFDFRIEPCAIDLLKIKNSLYRSFSTSKLITDHPRANFKEQAEHIFWDNLQRMAESLIENKIDLQERVISFSEFQDNIIREEKTTPLSPMINIFDKFDIKAKSIFWVRLVCYGYVCKSFSKKYAHEADLNIEEYSLKELITYSDDRYFLTNIDKLIEEIRSIADPQFL
jgi:hypothetical protein